VDVLVTGKSIELLDARLHVVARHALALGDGLQVHPIQHTFVICDGGGRNIDAEAGLSLEDRYPELTLEHDLVFRRPEVHQFRAGVTGGEDIRNGHDCPV
jgi:hypothetical protein